jgi:hypothetical protein
MDARNHGTDFHIDSEASARRHVDLNGCLTHCWETENCYCATFKRDMDSDIRVAQHDFMENHWLAKGTCYMHHMCDEGKADKNVADTETCIVKPLP